MAGVVATRGSRMGSACLARSRSTLANSMVADDWARPRRADGIRGWPERAWLTSKLEGNEVDRGEEEGQREIWGKDREKEKILFFGSSSFQNPNIYSL